jgi:tetratricopeptide (TPR) repeat protein
MCRKDPAAVSSKKDKLIEEAQRMAMRGQLDKAIKAYEQVIALDPAAINQRQRLAELLVKAGRIDDARSEFVSIGKFYSGNGFYLKAIAVYKKLQLMFPGDITITLTLASLNEKHGLVANALAEYKQVYDYYEQNEKRIDAFKILEKMDSVDQKNVGIKLKLAEANYHAGSRDESYAIFGRLASLLQERRDSEGLNKLNARIKQLFPEKSEFMLEVLAEQIHGDAASAVNAVNSLQSLLRNNPEDQRLWELIIEAFRLLNQPQRVKVAYQHYIKFFPNALPVQKGLIECLVAEKDVSGALELLDQYDRNFIAVQATTDLLAIYRALELVDPINIRILQGQKRSYEAAGDEESAETIDHKITSLQTFSASHTDQIPEHSFADLDSELAKDFGEEEEFSFEENESFIEADLPDKQAESRRHAENEPLAEPREFDFSESEEIEIEVDIDDEISFAALDLEEEPEADLHDSADDVFDSIATSPRSVKFGSDVDLSDTQTHYDLGVAFKEMELYDEAISEFRHAALDPARKIPCFILQGACLREKGDLPAAESVLRSLLKPGLSLEDSCSVKYDLSLTCYAAGKKEEAAALLADIEAASPGFRDVSSRLDATGMENTLDFSDEDLQSFDLR